MGSCPDSLVPYHPVSVPAAPLAPQLHAQAYKLLAQVAGCVMGDYGESYAVFAR
jgi:hypothetical protein